MEEKNSSHKKPSEKASIPNRSTTFTTTENREETSNEISNQTSDHLESLDDRTSSVSLDPTEELPDYVEGELQTGDLTDQQKKRFVRLFRAGGSPVTVCKKLEVTEQAFFKALRQDSQFKQRLKEAHIMRTQNVVSALYRNAMEGNVTAQTFWLKFSLPPEWVEENDIPLETDNLDDLSDEELIELARKNGIDLPPEIESKCEDPRH